MTGEQLETEIYFPTFVRLKHMPKDKVNYRARGLELLLTTNVQGRANDGGFVLVRWTAIV